MVANVHRGCVGSADVRDTCLANLVVCTVVMDLRMLHNAYLLIHTGCVLQSWRLVREVRSEQAG